MARWFGYEAVMLKQAVGWVVFLVFAPVLLIFWGLGECLIAALAEPEKPVRPTPAAQRPAAAK